MTQATIADLNQVLTDLYDEIGCKHDNEEALIAVHDMKLALEANSTRIDELMASNNALLARARMAEATAKELGRMLEMARGRLYELDNPRPTHMHKKRGSFYRTAGRFTVQTSRPIQEGDVLVGYIGFKGDSWARLESEFHDGRFEPVPEIEMPPKKDEI